MGVVKALSRGEIHQIQDSERFPIIEQVDEFVLSDFNSPNIEDLECFKIDTLEIKEDMFVSPQQLSEYLQDKSRDRNCRDYWCSRGCDVKIPQNTIICGFVFVPKKIRLYLRCRNAGFWCVYQS